jgi:flagellar protein FlaI
VKQLEKYKLTKDNVTGSVSIEQHPKDFVLTYKLDVPKFEPATAAYLDEVKAKLIQIVSVKPAEAVDPKVSVILKQRFLDKADELLKKHLSRMDEEKRKFIAGRLVQQMLGLGDIELLLEDKDLEEICINTATEPIWVYHKKYGWLKTNVFVKSETETVNYASLIGRRIGKSITIKEPLLDAYLATGDRVNATLYPVSIEGNTITIRKFSRTPWTITDYLSLNVLSPEVAALLWLAIQHEMNIIVAGGTASGKTTALNIMSSFMPPSQRVISIEQTRELQLPKLYQWVPMVVREPNPEGKGGISMLNLMINSLRMRPDRILVGEVRRAEEAEVMFEAMHTGHSVMTTLHAETVDQVYRRMTNPPISTPQVLFESLHLVFVMFRDRRTGLRRMFELAELLPAPMREGKAGAPTLSTLYKWFPLNDTFSKENDSFRISTELQAFTRMSEAQIRKDLKNREKLLKWLVENKVRDLDEVSNVLSNYMKDPEATMKTLKGKNPTELLK